MTKIPLSPKKVYIPRYRMEEIERALKFDRKHNKPSALTGITITLP